MQIKSLKSAILLFAGLAGLAAATACIIPDGEGRRHRRDDRREEPREREDRHEDPRRDEDHHRDDRH